MTKRSWTAARGKVDDEGCCRSCGTTHALEAAHIIPRSRTRHGAEEAANIIPLCSICHASQHAGSLELLPLMTLEEQACAVGLVGIAEAYQRTTSRLAA